MTTLSQRFWAKVAPGANGCWEWTAAKNEDGYGRFATPDGNVQAHRFAYEAMVAPIPSGLHLDHLCRNPACVNVLEHLDPVTCRVNLLRGETITARRAAQTHCHRGHPLDEANTYVKPNGCRNCRTCKRLANQRSQAAAA